MPAVNSGAFTPLEDWRFSHFRHHETFANLDARGYGDITLMTVDEYLRASPAKRFQYRLYRNPLVMFGLGPLFHFMFRQRFPTRHTGRLEHRSVLVTDLGIVAVALILSSLMGWKAYLLIQSAVLWMAGAAGIWLFYVQHQFEGVYWARTAEWDPVRAAFLGASFYDLPAVLRWFSGNIGYHYVHHIDYGIPNYNLRSCYRAIPELRRKAPLTWRKSLRGVRLKLWDEEAHSLVEWPHPRIEGGKGLRHAVSAKLGVLRTPRRGRTDSRGIHPALEEQTQLPGGPRRSWDEWLCLEHAGNFQCGHL